MKKILSLVLVALLIVSLCACGAESIQSAFEEISQSESTAGTQSPITLPVTDDEPSTDKSEEQPGISSVDSENTENSAGYSENDSTLPAESEISDEESLPQSAKSIDEDGWYYDLENVTLYLMAYNHLPGNFITKKQAEKLGWSGGSVQKYQEGAAIGGSHFGNYEGILPDGNYTECDIDTDGASSRGAKRLVFSDDGRYYYTDDHYDTFAEIHFEDGKLVLNYDYE